MVIDGGSDADSDDDGDGDSDGDMWFSGALVVDVDIISD